MQMYGMTGEQLGLIGQPEETLSQLPAWKQDFLKKPSASVRNGIAWGFGSPYEDTDTLVLTATSGKFVDVRFPKDVNTAGEASTHASFWAFSGEVVTTFYDSSHERHSVAMPYTAHCQFLHDIDSRGPGIVDEGDMFLLANGDSLEMGQMLNPATGTVELYKEYWQSAGTIPDTDAEDDRRPCVVAQISSPEGTEGIMIRFKGRIQGIVSKSDGSGSRIVEVERCVQQASQDIDSVESDDSSIPASWTRDARSDGHMPCAWLSSPNRRQGDSTNFDNSHWVLTEAYE